MFEFERSIAFLDMEKKKPAKMSNEAKAYIQKFIPEDVSKLEVKI